MHANNPTLHDFSVEKIRENHAHVMFEKPVEESADIFRKILEHFNDEALQILALPCMDLTENYKALYCKSRLAPRVFASAGLEYCLDARDTKENFENQIREYHAMGFDGMKMLEGKITTYRKLGMQLHNRVLDGFYAYAEENRIPIVMHLGDPAKFWDPSQATEYAISRGWVYTEDEPSLEELRGWVRDVLERFPKLHLVLAHFYFMSDELERAAKMLDTYENICFDLTPGGEMFVNFTKQYDDARLFFEKYSDRLLYGTDMYNVFDSPEKAEAGVAGPRVFQLRSFLEKTEPFMAPNLSDKPLKPFGLPKEITDKIYRDNHIRLYGKTPRPLDTERILAACRHLPEKGVLSAGEQENLDTVVAYFQSLQA